MEMYRVHGEKHKKSSKKDTPQRDVGAKKAEKKEAVLSHIEASAKVVKKQPTVTEQPAAKKAKTMDPIAVRVNDSKPKSFIRQRVSKDFDGETYFGTIVNYDESEPPPFWHVEYDDGDEEDFSKKDLIRALKHYQVHGDDDPNKKRLN